MKIFVEALCMKYEEKTAISNLSLTFTPGIYGLLGANGAGKSTFMNILAGNLKNTGGVIKYDDVDILKLGKEYREKLGYMPQQQNIYDYMTGYEFLMYMSALKGIEAKTAASELEDIVKRVNLTDKIHKKIGGYSGGMKQRLLLAQAVLGNPEIIILDEPTAGLDPKERIHVRNIISEYAMNKIVIIATHIVTDIEFIAKEIIIMKNGSCIEKGTLQQLSDSMRDKVYEIKVSPSDMEYIKSKYLISNIYKEDDEIFVRIISDAVVDAYSAKKVKPNLEDKYLYVFENKLEG